MQILERPKEVTLLLALVTLPVQPAVMERELGHHPVSPLGSRRETAGSDPHWICVLLLPQSRIRPVVLVSVAPSPPTYQTLV